MASKGINFNVAKLTVNDSFRLAFCNLQKSLKSKEKGTAVLIKMEYR